MKIVSVRQMKDLESKADQAGLSYAMMMEFAGREIARIVQHETNFYGSKPQIIGLAGGGNNGGDTLIALDHLQKAGLKTSAFIYKRETGKDPLCARYLNNGGTAYPADPGILAEFWKTMDGDGTILLDGLLGTGIRLPLSAELSALLSVLQGLTQEKNARILSVDCPTGVDCDTGECASETLKSAKTICMGAVKNGLLKFPAAEFSGELLEAKIGFDEVLPGWGDKLPEVISPQLVQSMVPRRSVNAHKGSFGKLMIVAGSSNYCGAPLLCGKAASRSGAGLVTLCVTSVVHQTIAGSLPEATWIILPEEMGNIRQEATRILMEEIGGYSALTIGPGLGFNKTTIRFMESFLACACSDYPRIPRNPIGFQAAPGAEVEILKTVQLPMVIDADGLKCISQFEKWWEKLNERVVLTPHPGEMAQLTGHTIDQVQNNRMEIAAEFAKKWKKVVVLKGANTVISGTDGQVWVLPVATSALAHPGTGDALTGIIGSYLAGGMSPLDAAMLGCYVHAQCGLRAVSRVGDESAVLAGDLVDEIGWVIKDIKQR